MGPDQVVEIMRTLLTEAMLLCAPLLLAAALISLLVSLLQTLTSVQEQTLTAVPRLLTVFVVTMATMPWMIHRLTGYTLRLFLDFTRYLG
jgi:flagellar biosynthetic protein FliQ